MRNFILFLVGVVGSAHAMESFSGEVISDFLQGNYEKAISRAVELGKNSSNDAEKDRSKLFLKELFPRMLSEKKELANQQGAVNELLKEWDPENDCQEYYKMMTLLYCKAQERYEALVGSAAASNWQVTKEFDDESDDCVFPLPEIFVPQATDVDSEED